MRQLNINNLRLSVDALSDNAEREAYEILTAVNCAINDLNGNPALLITEAGLDCDYENTDDNEDEEHQP